MRWVWGCVAALVLGLAAGAACAYVEAIYSFQAVLDESTNILVGKIESVDPARKVATARMERGLKGGQEFTRVQFNLGTAAPDHAQYMLDRLKPGDEIIIFYQRNGNTLAVESHAGGTWFQTFAADDPANRDGVWWRMSHVEIRFNRTYDGPTGPLIKLTEDVLAKKRPPPPADPTIPPIDPAKPASPRTNGNHTGKSGGFHHQRLFKLDGGGEPRGLAWADSNTDYRMDLLLCRKKTNVLLINSGDGFTDMSAQLNVLEGSRSASWADYDGDGHPDLLLAAFRLFTNIGGTLRDDSKLIPAPAARDARAAAWIDFNGDGWPDVLVANGPHGLRLFENTGKGPEWFKDVSEKAGLGPKGPGAGDGNYLACFDYDGDGYADFFCNVGKGLLFHNERNGTFKAVTNSGLELPGDGAWTCGIAVADYDNDGFPDVFVPGPRKPRLYHNNHDGTFTDVTDASGDLAKLAEPSVSAAWGDVNSDGYLDLLVCCPGGSPHLYLGDGKGKFTEVTEAVGLASAKGVWAASFADVDGDGDLDLALHAEDQAIVATNEMDRPKDHVPVLVDMGVRRGQIGAVVRAFDEKGRLLGRREVTGADGCGGQPCPIVHFGLPMGKCRITVCLSDGRFARKCVDVKVGVGKVDFLEAEFE